MLAEPSTKSRPFRGGPTLRRRAPSTKHAAEASQGSSCTENTLFTEWEQIEKSESSRVGRSLLRNDAVKSRNPSGSRNTSAITSPVASRKAIPQVPCDLDDSVLAMVYRDTLKVVLHRMGFVSGELKVERTDLLEFAQSAFSVGPERHADFMRMEKNEEGPRKILKVTVHRGRDLKAKDENGFSDPFAIMGIVHLTPTDLEDARRKGKMKKVDRLAAQLVETSVQNATLNPVWDEEYELTLTSVRNRYLQLDLWDYDDENTLGDTVKSVAKISGVRGAKRWVKDLADIARSKSSDDFMGRFLFPLEEIPQEGIESWYDLEDRHGELKAGQMNLRLEFCAKQTVVPLNPGWHPYIVYFYLMKQCILAEHHSIAERQRRLWNYQLTNVHALTLLCQYRIQHSMSDINVVLIEFSVLVSMLNEFAVDYHRIGELLTSIIYLWKNPTKSASLRKDQISRLLADFQALRKHCLGLLSRLRQVFSSARPGSLQQLRHVLSCLERIYMHPVMQSEYPVPLLCDDIRDTIKQATHKWYLDAWELCAPQELSGTGLAEQLITLLHTVTDDLVEANHCYNQYFVRSGICYFSDVFKTLDSRMCSNVESTLQLLMEDLKTWSSAGDAGIELCSTMFKLFVTVRQLLKYFNMLEEKDRATMELQHYAEWFQPVVVVWFEVAEYKALQMVDKAVNLDKAVKVARGLKYSTSAVDIGNTVAQMVKFWKQLDWPEAKHRFAYVVLVLNSVHNVVNKYAEHVIKKLEKVSFYDAEGQFDVSEELCVVQNSLDHVAECMDRVPADLEWDKVADDYEGYERGSRDKAHKMCEQMVSSFHDDMNNKRSKIVERITDRMGKDIVSHMTHYVTEISDGKDRVQAINALMMYLDTNLQTMYTELYESTFVIAVFYLWECVLNTVKTTLLADSEFIREQRKVHGVGYYQSVKYLFDVVAGFFESDTLGMDRTRLKTDLYKELYSKINSSSQDSTMLMREYCQSLYASQLSVDLEEVCSFGTVSISIAYDFADTDLAVTILHAKGLPPLDAGSVFSHGKCDPFFVLTLEPQELFPAIVEQKTKVQTETVTPLYDETFHFQVSSELQKTAGCCLQLHCYERDRLKGNQLIGEAIVPILLSELGCTKSVRGKTHVLPLCHPQLYHDGAFNVLCTREEFCNDAASFLKRRRKVFQSASETFAILEKRSKKKGLMRTCSAVLQSHE